MEPRYLLIVKPPAGLKIWDTPRPQSEGAIQRRSEAKGAQLYAYSIHNFQGVPYARLVPRDPTKPEWVRVSEAGAAVNTWCDVIDLAPSDDATDRLAGAIDRLAIAVSALANKK